MSSTHFTRILVLVGALALARDAFAQAGDLDILSRTVPPVVMIQIDTSSSMRSITLAPGYRTARGTGSPSNWFNRPTNDSTMASYIDTTTTPYDWTSNYAASGENYERTCQIMPNSTTLTAGSAICPPGAAVGSCADDDDVPGQIRGNNVVASQPTIRCWGVPSGCAHVPAPFTCTTTTRARRRTGSLSSITQNYTTIGVPDVSYTSLTMWSPNYLWWMLSELYQDHSIPNFPTIDRLGAAKQAITDLVNQTNTDPNHPRVKFGLSRYSFTPGGSSDDNGGFVVVPADLNNKATLLSTVAGLHAGVDTSDTDYAGTPLSEALVDTARYLAGADKLGGPNGYPVYKYRTTGTDPANANHIGDPNIPGQVPPSPLTSSCEKAFIIVVTDGLPTGDSNNHYTTSCTSPANSNCFPKVFGTFNDADSDTNNDHWTDDVARMLYATDIRPTLSGNQNVITYAVGISLDSPILQAVASAGHGQYLSTNDADDLTSSLVGAISDIIARNTTLTSATVPATRSAFGNGFYTAYFLPSGLKTVWPGHLEAYTLDPSLVVRDDANNPAIDPSTNLFYEPRHPHWDAGARLIAQYQTRKTYTSKMVTLVAGFPQIRVQVDFTAQNMVEPNDPSLTTNPLQLTPVDLSLNAGDVNNYPQPATHKTVTDPNAPAGSLLRLGQSIVNFTRGVDAFDDDNDNVNDPNTGLPSDVRNFVFGDVFHSSPVAVGPPLPFLRFETGYGPATPALNSGTFMDLYGHRKRVLYVGANDGFVHGFDAGDWEDPNGAGGGDERYTHGNGNELFGYLPGFLLPKVKDLPRDSLGAKRYFVDGPPTAADAWIDYNFDGQKTGDEWTTVLILPAREGGEGLVALDVSNPAATSGTHGPYPRLMWEFTDPNQLGQTWSRPIITRVKVKGDPATGDLCGAPDGDGDCKEVWVAIFGAGYEPEGNPNMGAYISNPAVAGYPKSRGVYIVGLQDGNVIAHLQSAPAGAPSSNIFTKMKYSIAAEPTVLDMDNDGFADLIYIGDLGGQMWKWDIGAVLDTTASPSPWIAQVLFEAPVVTVAAGLKHYHSIFQGAAAALSSGRLTLSFASGERADLGYMGDANATDPNNMIGLYDDNNRFWVVKDPFVGTGLVTPTGWSLPILETATVDQPGLTDITLTKQDNTPNDAGYFFKVAEGQKFMTDHIIFDGIVVTLAYLPDLAGSGSGNNCALGGTTFEYAWTLANGTGVLIGSGSGSGSPAPNEGRGKVLGNGAPTNPRITISRTDSGDVILNATVQTSSGEVKHPEGLPPGFDPVEQVFWRQDF